MNGDPVFPKSVPDGENNLAEMKKIDSEALEKVDGGMAAAYRRMHQDLSLFQTKQAS